jgi:hypothetical protein
MPIPLAWLRAWMREQEPRVFFPSYDLSLTHTLSLTLPWEDGDSHNEGVLAARLAGRQWFTALLVRDVKLSSESFEALAGVVRPRACQCLCLCLCVCMPFFVSVSVCLCTRLCLCVRTCMCVYARGCFACVGQSR